MVHDTTRRRFLATAGLSAAVSLTGVAGAAADDGEPSTTWTRQFERDAASEAAAVADHSEGGHVVAATADTDGEARRGWVFATDGRGELDWGTAVAEKGITELTDVIAAADGYVAVGHTQAPDDWRSREAVLAKVADGETRWVRTVTGPGGGARDAFSLAPDGDGYLVAGRGIGEDARPAWLFRADADGNVDWRKEYEPGTVNYFYGVESVDRGHAITGFTDADCSGWSGWALRLDEDRSEWWSRRFAVESADEDEENHDYNVFYDLTETVLGFLCVGATSPAGDSWDAWAVAVDHTGDEIARHRVTDHGNSRYLAVSGTARPLIGGRVSVDGTRYGWVRSADSEGGNRWDRRVRGPVDGYVADVRRADDDGALFVGRTNPADESPSAAWVGKLGGDPLPAPDPTGDATDDGARGAESGTPSPTPAPGSNGTATADGPTPSGTATAGGADAETDAGEGPGADAAPASTTGGPPADAMASGDGPGFGVAATLAGLGGLLGWRRVGRDDE